MNSYEDEEAEIIKQGLQHTVKNEDIMSENKFKGKE